jgi:hypothetical protein
LSFGGRAVVFCGIFGVGYTISNRRVKLIPAKLQVVYFVRTDGMKEVENDQDLLADLYPTAEKVAKRERTR